MRCPARRASSSRWPNGRPTRSRTPNAPRSRSSGATPRPKPSTPGTSTYSTQQISMCCRAFWRLCSLGGGTAKQQRATAAAEQEEQGGDGGRAAVVGPAAGSRAAECGTLREKSLLSWAAACVSPASLDRRSFCRSDTASFARSARACGASSSPPGSPSPVRSTWLSPRQLSDSAALLHFMGALHADQEVAAEWHCGSGATLSLRATHLRYALLSPQLQRPWLLPF